MTKAAALGLALMVLLTAGCEGRQLFGGGHPHNGQTHGEHNNGGHGGQHGGSNTGHGLAATHHGYTLANLSGPSRTGKKTALSFMIAAPGGERQTTFRIEQTKRMHVYVVRRDLAEFHHVHPEMADSGTWSVPLAVDRPGPYRVVAEFVAEDDKGTPHHLVLGKDFTVRGDYRPKPLPPDDDTAHADGYELALTGYPTANRTSRLKFRITRDGEDVTDLQPYLGAHAHVTGFHGDTLAVTHLHPSDAVEGPGGPYLTIEATFSRPGEHRLFVQFKTGDTVHTAPITITVT